MQWYFRIIGDAVWSNEISFGHASLDDPKSNFLLVENDLQERWTFTGSYKLVSSATQLKNNWIAFQLFITRRILLFGYWDLVIEILSIVNMQRTKQV